MKENDPLETSIRRRDALKKIGTVATAIAAPTVLPARLLAQATAKSKEPPPSEIPNIGMIGIGRAMDTHLTNLLPRNDIYVRAVCDVDSRQRDNTLVRVTKNYRRVLAKYGKCFATGDHKELLAREDIDGVVVATPVHWNAAITLDAIRAGKDVMVQSPMSITVREGQLVADAASQFGAVVQVVTPIRCEPDIHHCCELIRNGIIGKVKEVRVNVGSFGESHAYGKQKVPATLDYDRWLGPAPFVEYHGGRVANSRTSGWRNYWEYGVRAHGEIGFGLYDIIQWALDREATAPVKFFAKGAGDTPYAGFEYADGPRVLINKLSDTKKDLEFVGELGTLGVSSRARIASEPESVIQTKIGVTDTRLEKVDNIDLNWIENLRSRRKPIVDAAIGHRTSSICHLAAIAERLGSQFEWDPEKQEIKDDKIAARMLDRPRRAPYTLS